MDFSLLKYFYSLGFVDGCYLGQGLQYGLVMDLCYFIDFLVYLFFMWCYSLVLNIYLDYRYGLWGEVVGFQEVSLVQYSVIIVCEISCMCVVFNFMDQYGGWYGIGGGGFDFVQYQFQYGFGFSVLQSLVFFRFGFFGNFIFLEGYLSFGNFVQYGFVVGQGIVVRQLLLFIVIVCVVDGMIYLIINILIVVILFIIIQFVLVLWFMVCGGMYRFYVFGGIIVVLFISLICVFMIVFWVFFGFIGLY